MIPNTYRWLQSVCLLLPPTKHLNSRTLWWVEGWKPLLHVFLLCHTPFFPSSPSPYSTSSSLPVSSQILLKFAFVLSSKFLSVILLLFLSLWPLRLFPVPSPPLLHPYSSNFRSCWQGAAIYLPVPAREWVMCVSPIVAEGAAEPDANIRCESSHL